MFKDHPSIQRWLGTAAVLGLRIHHTYRDGIEEISVEPHGLPCDLIAGCDLSKIKFQQGYPLSFFLRQADGTEICFRLERFPTTATEGDESRRLAHIWIQGKAAYFIAFDHRAGGTRVLVGENPWVPTLSSSDLLCNHAEAKVRDAITVYSHLVAKFGAEEPPEFTLIRRRAEAGPLFGEDSL